jgi:hypothetical protein
VEGLVASGDEARQHMIVVAHELEGLPGKALEVGLTRVPVQEFYKLPGSRTGNDRILAY